jgi:hypothetical protein
VALVASAVFAGTASANPTWQFNGTELSGSETVVGAAFESALTIPGLTTTCEHFLYNMSIENSGGTGEGEIGELPLFDCHTDQPACTVEAIEAEELPWPTHLTAVEGKPYIVIEGIHVSILYGGANCAADGFWAPVEGTAGGLIDNENETATFNASSFSATGTELSMTETPIEWMGVFPTEAFEWHREEALSAG